MTRNGKIELTAKFYDELVYGLEPEIARSRDMLKAFPAPTVEDLKDKVVLEVGTGRGEWALGLGTHSKRHHALDLSGQSLVQTRDMLAAIRSSRSTFTRANVLSLPFNDNVFDAAYCIGVLHHTPCPKQGLRELVRVIKPGGVVNLMLYGRVFPRDILRSTVFSLARHSANLRDVLIKYILKIERLNIPHAFMFNSGCSRILLWTGILHRCKNTIL